MTLIEIVVSLFSALTGFIVMLLGYFGNRSIEKLDRLVESFGKLSERTTALESAATAKRLDDHESQLRVLHERLSQIGADVSYVKQMLERAERS